MNSIHSVLVSSLSTLPPPRLSRLAAAVSILSHRHLRHLSSLLSSPILFSLALRRLQSLSLHHKSLLVAQHLCSGLALLKHFSQDDAVEGQISRRFVTSTLRDLDAVLLLILLCEIYQHDRQLLDEPQSRWRVILCNYVSETNLRISNLTGCSSSDVLVQYVESIGRCWNLASALGGGCGGEGKEFPASATAVVALPSVAASGGRECAICTEEMKEGREVCELPCRHSFHWMCILRWLRKRDTCPCCRHRLPSDDVGREIERLVDDLARIGGGGRLYGEYCW